MQPLVALIVSPSLLVLVNPPVSESEGGREHTHPPTETLGRLWAGPRTHLAYLTYLATTAATSKPRK